MTELWDRFFYMWNTMDCQTIFKWGWFIFLLDFPRYFLIEGFVLFWSKYNRRKTKDLWNKAKNDLFKEMPLVTVLVPGHNEGKHLYKLIASMRRQTFQNLEIIVIDDGSTDDTALIGRSFERKGFIHRFISASDRGGKASAANLGLRYSKGKYVVHLDADSSLNEDAIEKILIPFYRFENIGGVGGNLMVRNEEDSLTTTMQFIEYLQSISVSRIVLSRLNLYKIISGAFGAFPRELLERIGGWDIGPGLDGDITVKIRKINYKIFFEEEAICKTHAPVSWRALTKQRLRWSRSLVRFRIRKHKDVWFPDKNFKVVNFVSFFENVFFSFFLDFIWFFYIFKILFTDPTFLLFWFPFKYTIYLLLTTAQYFFAIAISKNKKHLISKLIYIPLYPIYMGYYMRIVRTISYLDELFFYDSYKDSWNPIKTSKKAKEFGM